MRLACKQTNNLFLFFLLLAATANGQPKCKVEYYSTQQGLSHQRVTAVLKDREGFMWFGSWDGINRFDGHSFVSYKSSPGDMSQLGNDRIDQIIEDQFGYLWIQSYDKQIYRFDKKTEQFHPLSSVINQKGKPKTTFTKVLTASSGYVWLQSTSEGLFCIPQNHLSKGGFIQYKKELATPYQLPSNTVNFFYEDIEHQIWIGTPDGLCCLVRSDSGVYHRNKLVPREIAYGVNVSACDEDASDLYFMTDHRNLVIYNKKHQSFTVHKISDSHLNAFLRSRKMNLLYFTTATGELIIFDLTKRQTSKADFHFNAPLNSLYEDKKGNLWIEPDNLGVIRFDPIRRSFNYFSRPGQDGLAAIGNRYRVFEDNNNTVWVNMKGGGFGYYNEATQSVDFLINTPDVANYRLPNLIYTIYYDLAGILWLTTYEKELVKITLQSNDFKQQLPALQMHSVTDNEVRGIFYDNKNRLWLGAKSGKLYVYQNNQPIGIQLENAPREGIGLVYSITQDSRNNIWLGTKGKGLYKATPVNKEETRYHLTHWFPDKSRPNSLRGKDIYAVLEDRQGRVWIGTFDEGLNLAQEAGDSIIFVHTGNGFRNYPKGAFQRIRHMALDSEGNLWIATTDGLVLLDANDQHSPAYTYTTYSKIPGAKESLGNNDIQFIHRDAKNRMWISTSGGGLCLANGSQPFQTLKFRNYTTRDGLPNDYLLSCAEDKQGNLWIATENGLSKFNPDSQTFRNYDSYDGVQKVSFSEASVCRGVLNGQLVFGTSQGFLTFDPERINVNRIPANIVFTNLQINNEDAGPGMNESVLKTNINYVSDLTLKYDQNIISIDYALLDHRVGNRQEFAYRLVGFDNSWHKDRQLNRTTYTNLPPGHYMFEVKSLSNDLYSNTPYKQLSITILPPPWKTWWAYAFYVILLAVILYFIRRYALAMIRLRNKVVIEQKLAALKLNFFTNISHELRTPLTLIVNPLEQLSKKEKLSPEGSSYVDVARKNAERMVRFINQLLDLRKVQSDKATLRVSRVEIITFVKKIADHFTEAARSKRIKLELSSDQKELFAWVDAEKLDVVIYNLLGNALKFTPEGKSISLMIGSFPNENSFFISVYDQGPGVDEGKLEEIFELFHEVDQINNRQLKGSGIGLALSREFVNLHGGKISAENNNEGGLTVTVVLKLGSDHFKMDNTSFVEMPKTSIAEQRPIEQQILPQPVYTSAPKDHESPSVLLVEDNDELRAFLAGQLREYYQVETAKDGQEGYEKAVSLIPDLIVSDIMMPIMDGIQMLDKVKNDVNTSHIPVVLLSAKYSVESQIEGLQYGADYYITKPFNTEFLIASINNLVRQRKKLFQALVKKNTTVELGPEAIVVTSKDETFLKDVIKVVETKMADAEFNIDLVAETLAMSRTTFYKKFKSLTGFAPVEFVRDMRLQRAKQYLDAGGSNISEVAYLSGFSNPKYFSTCFKEKYHVSPSDYQKAKAE
jgi:signal transduction histidine kinase/ligand-binding sensor domain-containing protein/DNA-binding response OmpR family regulator